jgi:diguanylate cyclase (GGDEF)-like protein/PAS domain S-box-containing protein
MGPTASKVDELLGASAGDRRRPAPEFQTILSALEEGVLVQDASGGVRSANPAAERMLGLTAEELAGGRRPDWELIHEDGTPFPPEEQPARLCLTTGRAQPGVIIGLSSPDGSTRWIRISTVPLFDPATGRASAVVSSFADVSAQLLAERELERRALSDPLTGVANRTLLAERIEQALHRQARTGSSVVVLLIDLDRFKLTNDSLGHLIGDEVLMAAARRLTAVARPADTVARLGGDEFAVVAEGVGTDRDVNAFAARVLESLRAPIVVGSEQIFTTASVGVTVSSDPLALPSELLRQADLALYQAKECGRDGFARYDLELEARAADRLAMERVVRRALAEDGLRLEYQPIVDLRSERVVMAEALLRIEDPEVGYLVPAQFLEVAEDAGLAAAMDAWVLSTAIAQMAHWHRSAGRSASLPVAVNVTAAQLADPGFAAQVAAVLDHNGVTGRFLQVEVTERALLEAPAIAGPALEQLRAMGVSVGLDDFGTGFSALSCLQQVPLDFVKIDRSFVAGVAVSHRSEAIVTAVIDLAHALGLSVIAEGVETVEQMHALQRLHCDRAQGFLFSPAQPPTQFATIVSAALAS